MRNRINRYGELENKAQREKARLVAETFRGYADIEINNAFPMMLRSFDRAMDQVIRTRLRETAIGMLPQAFTEIGLALGMALLVALSLGAEEGRTRPARRNGRGRTFLRIAGHALRSRRESRERPPYRCRRYPAVGILRGGERRDRPRQANGSGQTNRIRQTNGSLRPNSPGQTALHRKINEIRFGRRHIQSMRVRNTVFRT